MCVVKEGWVGHTKTSSSMECVCMSSWHLYILCPPHRAQGVVPAVLDVHSSDVFFYFLGNGCNRIK